MNKLKSAKKYHGKPCHWCGRPMQAESKTRHPTRDHVLAKTYAGKDFENIVWACFCCNQIKADMKPKEWRSFMQAQPQWWELYDLTNLRGRKLFNSAYGKGWRPDGKCHNA